MARFNQPLRDLLATVQQPTTVTEVVEILADIQEALGGWTAEDPLAAFNYLYHRITSEVLAALPGAVVPTPSSPSWEERSEHRLAPVVDRAIDRLGTLALEPLPAEAADLIERWLEEGNVERLPRFRERFSSTEEAEAFVRYRIEEIRARAGEATRYEPATTLRERLQIGFEDPAFMEDLDVAFANLYLGALRAWVDEQPVPKAWEVLFEVWDHYEPEGAITGALLGVNAHINHDLAISVAQAHQNAGSTITDGSARHRDYLVINDIFVVQTPILYNELVQFLPEPKRVVYELFDLGTLAADETIWLIEEARALAWNHAKEIQDGEVTFPAGSIPIDPERDPVAGALAEAILATPA